VVLAQGVSTHIKLKAAGELQESGKREVYFEANGVPRVVEVVDKKSTEVLGKAAIREKVRLEYKSYPSAVLGACLC
jgi:pyruvate carboxylase